MSRLIDVKAYTAKLSSGQYQAWASDPTNRVDVELLNHEGRVKAAAVQTSQSQPTERYAVIRACAGCGRDTTVASDFQGVAVCSDKCKKDLQTSERSAQQVLLKFAESEPRFYRCAHNTQVLVDAWQAQAADNPKFEWTANNLRTLCDLLLSDGRLLPTLTVEDIHRMEPAVYNRRLQLDPDLGGHRDKIDKKEVLTTPQQARSLGEAATFEPSAKVQAEQNANYRDLQAKSSAYTNRYESVSYHNGMPVEAPKANVAAVYRNGRRVI